jgi:CubicO group peptidase (beta-lactamase class C family)
MTSHFVSISSLALIALHLAACNGDDDTTTESSPGEAAIADLEAKAERMVAAGVPGVSIAVVENDQSVLIARGVADLESGEELTPAHRFRVASMAKSVLSSRHSTARGRRRALAIGPLRSGSPA